jgi:flagellar biosynthesis protein FlhA
VQELHNNLAKRAPKAVENLVPGVLPLGTVQKVLQNLVRESISIRDMLSIAEALSDYGPAVQDAAMLTEYVRSRMGRTIVKGYLSSDNALPIVTLSSDIDATLQSSLRNTDQGGYLALEPNKAQQIIKAIASAQENAVGTDGQPVLLTTPQVRPHLAQLLLRFLPTMPVISQAEIPADIRIQSMATVTLG